MAEDKIINNKGGKEKPAKKAKAVKLLSAKKLPSMFKKQYTEKIALLLFYKRQYKKSEYYI